ncbi:glycerophosphodiester phosphodiesterase family protein [Nocardioides donggukensis]|uniref:glycerophosphodiester phosphodiesterase n=1 Tax=Nocardioides donggukensis TaxID=2774019 RepID=A0A927K269_9ACTN|nr:glycerophosphodiester phosphodiesterase family protein [Nocardioides donggukensis]MBD8868594.1 glycerophosphodiester phosphodiesterase [Nocardioides donggukensis]
MTELDAPHRPHPSLVVTPAVVAHRGASGYRPEHTLEGYRLAARLGADDIELDLVPTRDGVLVARHGSELSATTDVADHPEYADRRTARRVDGVTLEGWFAEDFTLAEIKTLTARERFPDLRPGSAAYDGRFGIPTLNEVLAMVHAESTRSGRTLGVMLELKHAAHFAASGLPLEEPLLRDLGRHGLDHARSRVTVMSFEPGVLRRLARRTTVQVVQLLDEADRRPADLVADGDHRTYADLCTPAGLAEIDEYADGVAAHTSLVLPRSSTGEARGPSSLVRDAHRQWLTVHVWTLRAEDRFLPTRFRSAGAPDGPGRSRGLAAEAGAVLDAGCDGVITDQPDVVLEVLAQRALTRPKRFVRS